MGHIPHDCGGPIPYIFFNKLTKQCFITDLLIDIKSLLQPKGGTVGNSVSK